MELAIINRRRVFPYRRTYQIAKRIMDLVLCLMALPFVLPVMGLLALLVRLDSPGPALFVQERIGRDGRPFQMYKFRSMSHNLDDSHHRVFMKAFVKGQIGGNEGENGVNGNNGTHSSLSGAFATEFVGLRPGSNGDGNGQVYKPAQDSQITRVGCILRKTSLDELPQIFNVFKGEMSLVGPRPNVRWEVEEYQLQHTGRLDVLPGITGLAQVMGRSGISFDSIVQYDIEYIEKQSLVMDMRVLWWTLVTVSLGIGAK